jgi:hypothetical protein
VISTPEYADVVKQKLHEIEAVGEIIHAVPGRGARLIDA